MVININYQKRKNTELFKTLEDPNTLFLSNIQNYIPIYNKFFYVFFSGYEDSKMI